MSLVGEVCEVYENLLWKFFTYTNTVRTRRCRCSRINMEKPKARAQEMKRKIWEVAGSPTSPTSPTSAGAEN
jgi:hypothetical protein